MKKLTNNQRLGNYSRIARFLHFQTFNFKYPLKTVTNPTQPRTTQPKTKQNKEHKMDNLGTMFESLDIGPKLVRASHSQLSFLYLHKPTIFLLSNNHRWDRPAALSRQRPTTRRLAAPKAPVDCVSFGSQCFLVLIVAPLPSLSLSHLPPSSPSCSLEYFNQSLCLPSPLLYFSFLL